MKFKIFKNLQSDDVQQAYRQGLKQKEKVQTYGWWDRNFFHRPQYKQDVQKLYDVDQKVTRKKQDLLASRALATLGTGLAAVAVSPHLTREKTASRLLQILKGTRVKQLKGKQKLIGDKLTGLSFNKGPQREVDTLNKAYGRVSKNLRKERIYTNLSRGALGSAGLMGVLKANRKFKEKKASLSQAQKIVLTGTPIVGAATGTAAVLGTKDIENSPKNLASAAAIGAGTTGAFSGGAYFLIKNPHLINKLKQLAGQ